MGVCGSLCHHKRVSWLFDFICIKNVFPSVANYPQTHLGLEQCLRCLPSILPRQQRLSWRHTSSLRVYWRTFHFPGSHCLSCGNTYDPGFRHPYYASHRSRVRNCQLHWCQLCFRDMALIPQSRHLLRLGNGVPFRWQCWHRGSMVYDP